MRKVGDRWREDGGKKGILLASYVVVGGREEDILLLRATEATAEANAYAHRMPIAGDGDDFPSPLRAETEKKNKKRDRRWWWGGPGYALSANVFVCLPPSLFPLAEQKVFTPKNASRTNRLPNNCRSLRRRRMPPKRDLELTVFVVASRTPTYSFPQPT